MARDLTQKQRYALIDYLKMKAEDIDIPFYLDEAVTIDMKKLLRLPFSLHGTTENVVVPIDISKMDEFDVTNPMNFERVK